MTATRTAEKLSWTVLRCAMLSAHVLRTSYSPGLGATRAAAAVTTSCGRGSAAGLARAHHRRCWRIVPIPANSHKTLVTVAGSDANCKRPDYQARRVQPSHVPVTPLTRRRRRRPRCSRRSAAHSVVQVVAADLGHRPHRERDQVGRVGAAAVRHRGQVRRVGLDQHPVERGHRERVAQRLGVLERHRAGEATGRRRGPGRRGRTRRRRRSSASPSARARPPRRSPAARRRGRRGRGSPASCRAAWPGRCAAGTTPPAPPGPSSPVRKWSSPVSPTARTWSCAPASALDLGQRGVEVRRPAAAPRWGAARRRPRARRALAAASTAQRAPGRSQPICTIRVTPTAAASVERRRAGAAHRRRRRCRGGSGCRRPGAAAARAPAAARGRAGVGLLLGRGTGAVGYVDRS